jgi:hypothetical protein
MNLKKFTQKIAVVAIVVTIPFVGIESASAATPRYTQNQCNLISETNPAGYVVPDSSSNRDCIIGNGVNITIQKSIRKNKRVFVRGTFKNKNIPFVKIYFVRGATLIVRTVKVNKNGSFSVKQKLRKKGKWAVIISRGGKTASTTLVVR